MGYTHYWTVNEDTPTALIADAGAAMGQVMAAAYREGLPLVDMHNQPMTTEMLSSIIGPRGVNQGIAIFNGVGEDSHETFVWHPEHTAQGMMPGLHPGFWFCKTAQKPYDVAVVACLLVAQEMLGDLINVSSDASDWDEFVGRAQSEGWQAVNAMLGQPTSLSHPFDAVQLYEQAIGMEPSKIPAFA